MIDLQLTKRERLALDMAALDLWQPPFRGDGSTADAFTALALLQCAEEKEACRSVGDLRWSAADQELWIVVYAALAAKVEEQVGLSCSGYTGLCGLANGRMRWVRGSASAAVWVAAQRGEAEYRAAIEAERRAA